MPQMHLPFSPDGVEHITSELAFEKKDGQVTYFNGHMPVFIHGEEDIAAFRMITAQFCLNGNAKQADISRAFGITLISVKRAVKLYRQKGVAGREIASKLHTAQDSGEVCFVPTGFEPLVLYPQLLCPFLFYRIHRNVTQQGKILRCVSLANSAIIFP